MDVFAAGLVLEGVPFQELLGEEERVEDHLTPLSIFLVPIFFVRMGLHVDLGALAGGSLALAAALTVAAIVGPTRTLGCIASKIMVDKLGMVRAVCVCVCCVLCAPLGAIVCWCALDECPSSS